MLLLDMEVANVKGNPCEYCGAFNVYSSRTCTLCGRSLPWAQAIDEAARHLAEQSSLDINQALRASEGLLREVQQIAKIGSWELELATDRFKWSDEIYEIMGLDRELRSPTSQDCLERVHPDDRDWFKDAFDSACRHQRAFEFHFRVVQPEGEVRSVQCRSRTNHSEVGELQRVYGTLQDVTEHARVQEALRKSERQFRVLTENSSDILSIHDATGRMVYQGTSLRRGLGYEPEEILGLSVLDFIREDYRGVVESKYAVMLANPEIPVKFDVAFRHKDGSWRYFECTGTNLLSDPAIQGIVFNARDITERKDFEEQLIQNSFHDRLTELSNRARLLDYLRYNQNLKLRDPQNGYSVLLLDLDRFKVVNEVLGHYAGDALLCAVARRLEKCVRHCDVVARLGGDEFVLLLTNMRDLNETLTIANRVLHDLKTPFVIEGQEVFTSTSIGIVLDDAPVSPYSDAASVLRDADVAMYRAKARGKSRYEVFNEEFHRETRAQHQLETLLRRAVNATQNGQSEFFLQYQPIVSLLDEEIVGFESLVRWQQSERGFIGPNEFIPIAEETGLILPMGQWILREACHQMDRWQRECMRQETDCSALSLSVNVSGRQIAHNHLVTDLAKLLNETGLAPQHLHVEITESTIVGNTQKALETLEQCRELGVKIALDDFGTGYSSLSYLHRFPIDILKIDRSFTNRITDHSDGFAIVRAIINLATSLGLDVVAEGVETRQQRDILASLGCQYGQGYLWSKPVDSAAAWALLQNRVCRSK